LLSPAQQERYARHLLLDGFGGEGQERLLVASVRVLGAGLAARWAARYLAASGVGRLDVDPAFAEECLALGPWLSLGGGCTITVAPAEGATTADSAISGAAAALDVLRSLA
jgi:hypothetical protein